MSIFTRPRQPRLVLGTYGSRLWPRRFVLDRRDISTHKHVIGLTGQGKSKLLASLFVQLLRQGIPAALIDPHSDLATDVLGMLLEQGLPENVIYVPFNRTDRYLPFNVLKAPYDDHSVARHVVEVCKRVWPSLAEGAAPMFENVMLASSLTLIQNGLPITQVPRLITDRSYRDMLLRQVTDPQVVHFFKASFDNLRPVDQLDQAQSSLRRVFLLTFSPTLRYSLGQQENALDFRRLMDDQVSVIYDLGGLDEETQKFLGGLISVGYEVAALSRANIPVHRRTPYHLIMDEFSMFSAQSEEGLARILSLARKYGLFLVLAHQTWSQVSSRLQGALQNTTSVAFRLGRTDAEWMGRQLAEFDPMDVKHVVAEGEERSHPIFWSAPETFETLTQTLENLKPRRAFVKVHRHNKWYETQPTATKLKTLRVPEPKVAPSAIQAAKDVFAERLMTSAELVVPEVDAQPVTHTSPPKRATVPNT